MTTRITAMRAAVVAALALASFGSNPSTATAADREHQQMMADLRMLQEQANQLQMLMTDLGEALRAVNSRLDDQTGLERKAFADGKVQMDTISGDLRVVRERVDETNVRLGSISQELETLRQAIPEPGMAAPVAVADTAALPGAPPPAGAPPAAPVPAPTGTVANPVMNPQRLWEGSWGDYTSGNYSLAVTGFQTYLNNFPKGPRAHEAQLLIGEALSLDNKDTDAVAAYDRVIANYPGSPSVPQAYYKRGMALQRLGQSDRAKESFEATIKQFPDSPAADLAKQRLETLNRPAR